MFYRKAWVIYMASKSTKRSSSGRSPNNRKKTNTKTSTKSNTKSNKRTSTKEKQQETIKDYGLIQDEIILIITFVVSILLFLSNFDLSGRVGRAVSTLTFGLIGVEAYILPFAIFFGTAFHLSNIGSRLAGRKIMSGIVFLVVLTALLQLLTTPFNPDMKIFQYFTDAADFKRGGGLIGGILVMILCGLFDTVATYIIIVAIMIISLVVITGKAGFLYLWRKFQGFRSDRREYHLLREEQSEALELVEKEKQQRRRKAKTFVLDPEVNNTTADSSKMNKNNLDHLFPEDKTSSLDTTSNNYTNVETAEAKGTIPTYEDILINKFGNVPSDNEVPNNGLLSDTADLGYTSEYLGGNSTAVEYEQSSQDTPVELVGKSSINETATIKEGDSKRDKTAETGASTETTSVEDLDIDQSSQQKTYVFPSLDLLSLPKAKLNKASSEKHMKDTALKLQSTLDSFGVNVTITNVSRGPAVTRYELQPEQGVKVSKITSLADDIKLNLAAADIRIEAPIPGKAAVGIEVPNKENSMVSFREIIESKEFTNHPSDIAFAVGKDIGGQTVVTDIAKMPHMLIAGATGSGKSVCINTLIMSILYKSKPSDVRLIMIDPKVVELSVYNGIPHLLIPVVTDPKKASAALNWAVMEMTERYKKFAELGVRDLKGYNEKIAKTEELEDGNYEKLPQIVIIIDELADLMMVAPGEVEDAICRLAQMARAAGLHLIIATQRPSVNVITGLIKANIPSRIAFAVSSAVDSRTIIDGSGAEKLLGKGDMLFFPSGYPKPVRIQGAFVSDKEVASVVEFLKENNSGENYNEEVKERIISNITENTVANNLQERDEYFVEAGKFIIEKDKASIGMLQRVYRIGFNRAARIMDQLSEAGVVGPEEGTKPRKVLMSLEEFEKYLEENL